MTDPGSYPPPDQPNQGWAPPGQPPPGQPPPVQPPAGQPPPGQSYQPWAPPGQPPPPGYPYQTWPQAGQSPPGYPYQTWPQAGSAPSWPPSPPYPAAGQAHYSLDGLAAALTVLLAASAAANVTAIVLPGAKIAAALLFLPLIPVFLVWFFRARKNADGRGQTQRWGPGWSIGAWFTPFVTYVFPFQIMADIWRANLPGERRQQTAWLLGAWWACWIAGFGVVDIVRLWPRLTSGPDVVLHIVGGLLTAASAVLLIVIVRAVTHGPVGREPVAAQRGSVPQAWPTGTGAAYPRPDWGAGDGRRAGAGAGYALSGLAVAAVTAVAAALYWLPTAAIPVTAPRPTPTSTSTPGARYLTIDQLRAGDCLQGPPDVNTSNIWPDLVTAVPCNQEHLAEVYFASNYWRASLAFPGNAVISHQSQAECRKAFRAYDGIAASGSSYTYTFLYPERGPDWDSGDRLLLCVAYLWTNQDPGGEPLYASIKGSGG